MYITISTSRKISNANYLKYRLEREQISCNILTVQASDSQTGSEYKIEVRAGDVENAVKELLKIQREYPAGDFSGIVDTDNMLRILIPVDFSEQSFEACKYAIGIANKKPVEIKLLHVWNDELEDSFAVRNAPMIEDFKRIERAEIKLKIDTEIEKFSMRLNSLIAKEDTKETLFHFTVQEGKLLHQLGKTAENYKPNIIFAANNPKKYDFLNVNEEVINQIIGKALCPIFYLPENCTYTPIEDLNILYATVFNDRDVDSFDELITIFSSYDLDIHCVHIDTGNDNAANREKMKALSEKMEGEAKVHYNIINDKDLFNGLKNYISTYKINAVSFTSSEHDMWHKLFSTNNLKKMIKTSKLPLIIFRYDK